MRYEFCVLCFCLWVVGVRQDFIDETTVGDACIRRQYRNVYPQEEVSHKPKNFIPKTSNVQEFIQVSLILLFTRGICTNDCFIPVFS